MSYQDFLLKVAKVHPDAAVVLPGAHAPACF